MDVKFSNNGEMDIVQIARPDGTVVALPAEHVNAESGMRYCDMFAGEYAAFKRPPEEKGIKANEPMADGPHGDPINAQDDPPLSEYEKGAGYPEGEQAEAPKESA